VMREFTKSKRLRVTGRPGHHFSADMRARVTLRGRELAPAEGSHGSRDESGAVLILALLFLVVVGGLVGSLSTWASNDLSNTKHFAVSRTLQYAVSSATETAIQEIRYTPLLTSQLQASAASPSYCWGSGPTSQQTIDNLAVAVWCSTLYNPQSANTRVVTFSSCPVATSASQCASKPILQAVVTYGDYPSGYSAPTSTQCQVYCATTTTTVPPTTTTTTVPPTTTTTTVPPTTTTTTTTPRSNGITASVSNSNYSYYGGQELLNLTNPSSITALSITINVVQTSGTAYGNQFNSFPGGSLAQGTSTSGGYITYTYVLGSGQTIPANYSGQVGAQWTGTGTPRVTSGDTWSVTSTSGGIASTISGTF
jgi:hypothetical protein